MYYDFAGREIEDSEGDNMRRGAGEERQIASVFDPCPVLIEAGFIQMGYSVTHAFHLSQGWYVMHIEKEEEECSTCIGAVVHGEPIFISEDMMTDEIDFILSTFSAIVHDLQRQTR